MKLPIPIAVDIETYNGTTLRRRIVNGYVDPQGVFVQKRPSLTLVDANIINYNLGQGVFFWNNKLYWVDDGALFNYNGSVTTFVGFVSDPQQGTHNLTAGTDGSRFTGYAASAFGTLSPTALKTGTIVEIADDSVDVDSAVVINSGGGTLPQNFFIAMRINGVTRLTSAATFVPGNPLNTWIWSGLIGLVNTNSYVVTFIV